jgi:hypothetical protein
MQPALKEKIGNKKENQPTQLKMIENCLIFDNCFIILI